MRYKTLVIATVHLLLLLLCCPMHPGLVPACVCCVCCVCLSLQCSVRRLPMLHDCMYVCCWPVHVSVDAVVSTVLCVYKHVC